ncbi:hypothetical protein SUGI_0368870 [Cryptomeria japonica]|uniref:uncharacterized protein LOC131028081 n=1 Tax=Cryptomeria japonica TaxID=3369 RepID=UPI002408BDAC|nr:uncharacterized protein LOC131028081 [Cryptomeria japonica]GLJ20316.1 hypothetical protein SUGI_0368870 [Cryptomeria japonica]
MGEDKPSKLLLIFVLIADLVAFGLAVAAELNKSRARLVPDDYDEYVYCVYDTDIATIYGVGAFLLIGISHGLLMVDTKFLWGGISYKNPGTSHAWTILLFIVSWLTFGISEICLIWGSVKNTDHTNHRGIYNVTNLTCEEVPKGLFAAGAGFTLLTLVLSKLYYIAFVRGKENESSMFLVSLVPSDGDHVVGIDNSQKI